MAQAGRDQNFVPTLLGVSNADGVTPVAVYADPTTHRLLTDTAAGSGTVTSVSVVSANGFAGTVATATTTPAITLSTTVTGVLKGNGTAISAASAGTDYVAPGAVTTSGLTMSTAKMLGRATAATGAIEEIAVTGSGSAVLATSPALVTPNIGVATGTSLAATGVLTSGANAGTGGSLKLFGATSGDATIRVAAAAGTATIFQLPATNGSNTNVLTTDGTGVTSWSAAATGTVTAVSVATANGFSGSSSGGATPALTIVAGAITPTSVNGLTISSTTGTLTMTNGKTLSVSNTLTLAGTDSTTMTFPTTSATIARTDAAQTFTGIQTISNITLPANGQILHTVPSSSGQSTGPTTASFNSGYTSTAVGDLVYLDSSATWQKADATTSAATKASMLGVALSVTASGAAATVALPGSMVFASAWNLATVGAPVYMSTAGGITLTQPSATDNAIRVVGWVLASGNGTTKIWFQPSPDYITHT